MNVKRSGKETVERYKVRIRQLFHKCTGIVPKAEYFIQDHLGLSLHEVLLHTSAMMF